MKHYKLDLNEEDVKDTEQRPFTVSADTALFMLRGDLAILPLLPRLLLLLFLLWHSQNAKDTSLLLCACLKVPKSFQSNVIRYDAMAFREADTMCRIWIGKLDQHVAEYADELAAEYFAQT
ncbi:uncharacterized protein Z518_06044 [Rhinocladiella mackenziei CBS 650.93]|uniref:Uncharacterized protein n=1 Tax=Rhinocladiella mackenziei CBS 650.93 TaxID=1442369 RepID=A0A0D2FSS0_9EURO|nr:uncharacterized protein Z518_06044 [Rhinocladiella mackenziei CBS 650.93]KIX05172.1 hypothetical protein Z518_06044 [Rhinocladiella mackenziei CBS 650.93]